MSFRKRAAKVKGKTSTGLNPHVKDVKSMIKGILTVIDETFDSLTAMEQRVARFILDHPQDMVHISVQKLAGLTQTSEATIVRLSRKFRCKGFKELKLRIAADLFVPARENAEFQQVNVGSPTGELMESVAHNSVKSIQDTLAILSAEVMDEAIEVLSRARKIALFGIGASAVVAEDFKHKTARINRWCEAGYSGDMQAIIAANLTADDAALCISYTGENAEVLHAMRIAKRNGATVISLTQLGLNPIAEHSDIQLFTSTLEQNFRQGAMSSRIAQLYVIDLLYVGLVSRDYESSLASIEKTKRAVQSLHPGRESDSQNN
ncbi:MurR/RpiR family transcriptional regulator [Paenibacillus sp. HGF7]|uniref:MurR/RpiR family transcriptional regulator n=2 Tax=unclassified Paenibacillus TaxID=185978 RepID=UPI00020D6A80|nr:MurR/RpiR family transcriptional regulator [Paenibacillus sp. HGF7]EGL15318.1 SIS domain protein [Paenibacillus sp. HGF7]EPD89635.1 hypothetical protein HMPREF1207_01484 [Paenibacillus sp. HGH0039]